MGILRNLGARVHLGLGEQMRPGPGLRESQKPPPSNSASVPSFSLSETGSPCVLGSISIKWPQPATSKFTLLPSRRQAESAWTLLGPMLSSRAGSGWTSLRQVPPLGPSVRVDALESQLLPLWPGRPGKKRVVHYLGLQQKP